MKDVRFGYAFWGFQADVKFDVDGHQLSTPDGNATYSWSILWEAQHRGWQTHLMMPDRDDPARGFYPASMFSAFSREKRTRAYADVEPPTHGVYPELDVLLLEWRFPIPGRNTPDARGTPGFQPDLDIQERLLYHYLNKGTPVIVWDLDHKLLPSDEAKWAPTAIFETSVKPKRQLIDRVRVEPPCVIEDLLQFPTLEPDNDRLLVYVGSRYERDEVIDRYIKRASECGHYRTHQQNYVHFYGNWLKSLDECKKKWPLVQYHDRITVKDFREVYGDAVACPLLAKQSYFDCGFITPRIWEALMFGAIPIGFEEHLGIGDYLEFPTCVARDGADLYTAATDIRRMGLADRDKLRRDLVERISFMDVRHFLDRVEGVLDGTEKRELVEQPAALDGSTG